jgi:hypothetical protein
MATDQPYTPSFGKQTYEMEVWAISKPAKGWRPDYDLDQVQQRRVLKVWRHIDPIPVFEYAC